MRTSEWVKCNSPNFEDFMVSKDGKIIGKSGNIIYGHITKKGYVRITNNNYKKFLHRLIAETFIPNPNNYKQINHKDGNKLNNHIDNLEWCDNSYNQKHAYNVLHKNKYMLGKHHSEETKNKISNSNKNKKRKTETILKNSLSHKGHNLYGSNPNSCSIICLETNEIFDSIKRLQELLDINYNTLRLKIKKQQQINGYTYKIKEK